MDCDDARSIKQCTEMATCDAHDEEEQAAGWLTCLEEVFTGAGEVEVFGDVVRLVGFDLAGTEVVAVCQRSKSRARVTLESISPIGATRAQKLWLRAWEAWRK